MVVGIGFLSALVNAVGCLKLWRKSLEVGRVKDARMSVPFYTQRVIVDVGRCVVRELFGE